MRGAKGCVQVAGYLYIHVCECNVGVFSSVPQQERKKEKKLKLHVCINKYIPVPTYRYLCPQVRSLSLPLYLYCLVVSFVYLILIPYYRYPGTVPLGFCVCLLWSNPPGSAY